MIPHTSIGLSYTATCAIACRHCVTESSPHVRGKMTVAAAENYIHESKRAGFDGVCFTGGEPLLYYDEIIYLVGFATELGLDTNIMTSAVWATSPSRTKQIIHNLARHGLRSVCLSWGPFHKELIPLTNVLTVARESLEHNISVFVRTVVAYGQKGEPFQKPFEKMPGIRLEKPHDVSRLGRATHLPKNFFNWMSTPPRGLCYGITLPFINFDGVVYACCGPSLYSQERSPLRLGNASKESLVHIFTKAKDNLLLQYIAYWGPSGVYNFICDKGCANLYKLRDYYTSACELCLDLTNSPEIVSACYKYLDNALTRRKIAATSIVFKEKIYDIINKNMFRTNHISKLTKKSK